MFKLSEKQLIELGEGQAAVRMIKMARQLRIDFPEELAARDNSFELEVEELTRAMRDYGFRTMSHIYRLVAWGVFLGPDYIRDAADGRLAEIAAADLSEAERFSQIRRIVTSEEFKYRAVPSVTVDPLFKVD